jgi:hypothetical protein
MRDSVVQRVRPWMVANHGTRVSVAFGDSVHLARITAVERIRTELSGLCAAVAHGLLNGDRNRQYFEVIQVNYCEPSSRIGR